MPDISNAIAVIGLAGKFPGAGSTKEFWENLCGGVESIQFFKPEEMASFGIDPEIFNSPNYVRANGVLDGVDLFDAAFFGISPRDAKFMDPQHRLFMECAWETLENAAYNPDKYNGRIGIYAGIGMNNYLLRIINDQNRNLLSARGGHQIFIGNDKDFIPTRISYKFNLRGPSVNINTACSSSLVAVHFACQAILDYHCDLALAGGVAIQFEQKQGYLTEKGAIGSLDGHIRTFDEQAQGTVGGSGLGIVGLKRLSDAIEDGDFIYATILSTAINNDGSRKVSYTAPSLEGQAMVITEALALADVEPETISYIEAHGTGTALGDPIEVAALTKVFREKTALKQFCAIGSVKTNIGHLDTAAGIASLIKTILALHYQKIPKSLNYEKPNPQIDFKNSPFLVNTQLRDWPVTNSPRRAGVSSFGIGGTNSHAILEEAPPRKNAKTLRPYQLILYSAKTKDALIKMRKNLLTYCQEHPELNLSDIAYSLMIGRKEFPYRESIVAENRERLIAAFQNVNPPETSASYGEKVPKDIFFLFLGRHSPAGGRGYDLYLNEPSFSKNMSECSKISKELFQQDLTELLLKGTEFNLPVLFSIEYSLAQLLMEWGVKPTALLGCSLAGELAAATVAGIFTLEQALNLITLSARFDEATFDGKFRQKAIGAYQKVLEVIDKKSPTISLISSTTGDWLDPVEAISTDYWLKALQKTRYSEVFKKLSTSTDNLYLTIGPESTLIRLGNDQTESENKQIFKTMKSPGETGSDDAVLLHTLGKLWCLGVNLNPVAFYQHEKRQRIPLPSYPFERQSYWIENASLNKKSPPVRKRIDNWFYAPQWKQVWRFENQDADFPNYPYVMLVNQEEYGKKIALLLEKENKEIILVTCGLGYRKLDRTSYEINPGSPADYNLLFADLAAHDIPFSQIIHAYNLSSGDYSEEEILEAGFFSLMYLAQALGQCTFNRKITLTILSNNAHAVLGEDLLYPGKATLLGPCKVISQEYPEIECRQIDITLDLLTHPNLVAELAKPPEGLIIALRDKYRWLLTYANYPMPENKKALPLKEKGVYLITGGLGEVGLAFARYIAENYRGRLILTGHSFFPESSQWDDWLARHPDQNKISKKIRQLKDLEAVGSEIIAQEADVANPEAMDALFKLVREKWGGINGILHLAGIPGKGILQIKERKTALQVLKPKITGTLILSQLCIGQPLDFWVLFSSVNAIVGGVGQAEYCSANSFLDTFAHYQSRNQSYPIISINWDSWKGLGMAHRLLIEPELNIKGDYIFKEALSPEKNWYLAEHQLVSQPVLPGTAYLEILLQSLGKLYPGRTLELNNVHFQKPFMVEVGQTRELFTVLSGINEMEFDFEMKGDSNTGNFFDTFAKGKVKLDTPSPEVNLGMNIKNKFTGPNILLQNDFIRKPSLMQFGPRFSLNCDYIKWGDTESLGHFILPEEFTNDIHETVFHPALMDSATGYFLNRLSENYLPFLYEKIRIFAPIPERIYSYARHPAIENFDGDTLKIDLLIFNENWEPIVLIQGYTLRRINDTTAALPGEVKPAAGQIKTRQLRKDPDLWIAPEEGVEAFSRILASAKLSQIIVSTSDLKQEYENKTTFSPLILKNTISGEIGRQGGSDSRPSIGTEYQHAMNTVEGKIAEIWQENLGIKNIGFSDNFMTLGGDSLIATQIIAQLKSAFQVDIPLSSIFEDTTINNTAKRINTLLYAKNSMNLFHESAGVDEEEIIL